MLELKPISEAAIPAALQKAERYRLLNEPSQAESICLDVLRVDAQNQQALVSLLLALSDQLGQRAGAVSEARAVLPRLKSEYERVYYAGVISERLALTELHRAAPGAGYAAYEELKNAMAHFDKADALKPAGNDEAVLRWNTCARLMMRDSSIVPRPKEDWDHPTD